MDNGQWTMDNGQWTMDNGQWTMNRLNSYFVTLILSNYIIVFLLSAILY